MKINKLAVILSVVTAVSVLCSCTTSDKGNTESKPDTKSIVIDSSAEESSKAPAESSAEEISSEPLDITANFFKVSVKAEGKDIELTKEQQNEIFSLCFSQIKDDNAIDLEIDDSIIDQGIWINFILHSPLEVEGKAAENINNCGGLNFVCIENHGFVCIENHDIVFCSDSYGMPIDTVSRICEILGYEFSAETGLVTKYEHPSYEQSSDSENSSSRSDLPEITSEDLSEITPDMTYGEIISTIGHGRSFLQGGLDLYILDSDKILVLDFNSIYDVCGKSGQELAKEAFSRKVPEDVKDKINKSQSMLIYGCMIDDYCFYTEYDGYPEIIHVHINPEIIKYSDGTKANKSDLCKTPVLLEVDGIALSYPAQAWPKSVIIC